MKYAVVYSTRTGNTAKLADAVKKTHGNREVVYFGLPDDRALESDVIFVGFWTDRGKPNGESEVVLKTLKGKKVFLFGSAGFGGEEKYYEKILKKAERLISSDNQVIGAFMCQGKMPMSVKERYQKMANGVIKVPHLDQLIENFDKALSHPDEQDLAALSEKVQEALDSLT